MLDKAVVLEIVEEKFHDKDGAYDFISRDYLEILVSIIVDSVSEACKECKLINGGNEDGKD